MARIGLTLYSVRDELARDFEGTLRAVAAMGYEGVEPVDLYGHDARGVRALLDELGLPACSRHARLETIETQLDELAAEAESLGWRRLAVSWLDPATLEDAELPGRLERAAADAAEHGLELGFHNHADEVRPLPSGETFLDLVPPELFLELDLGWVWYAEVDPISLLERTRGRLPVVHVKDFLSREGRPYCPVGDGAVGYERVAPAAVRAGAEWLLVEQDEAEGSTLEAARRSVDALRPMLAEAA